MECKFSLEVFRFNCETDYLPYYKVHKIKIDRDKSVADLLELVAQEELNFGYPKDEFAAIKINNSLVFTSTKLEEIIDSFGVELIFEPISTRRATKDLEINRDDFENKFNVLEEFVSSKDKKNYLSYIREYYSSPIVDLEEEYLGDALFAFAYDMIIKYPNKKNKILDTIAQEIGVWLHVNISNRLYPINFDLERKVDFLKNEIVKRDIPANKFVAKLQEISSGF